MNPFGEFTLLQLESDVYHMLCILLTADELNLIMIWLLNTKGIMERVENA